MNYILAMLISSFFFVLTYSSAATEFTSIDLVAIAMLVVVVLGGEFIIAYIVARNNRVVKNLILAGFTTLNILYLNLVLNDVFISLPGYGQLLALLISLFIINVFMNMLDENPLFRKVLPAIFLFAIAVVLAQILTSQVTLPEVQAETGKTSAKNIKLVDFKVKPNVYFIAFDSLIPKVLLKKNLGLETTDYHEVLGAHFRRFRNFFSDGDLTKPSLNSLLALDLGHFNDAELARNKDNYFTGLAPSPLFEIFQHNGYETTTLYNSFYFGNKQGPYIDNYRVNSSILNSGVCEFIDSQSWRKPTFMGYCALLKSWKVRTALVNLGVIEQEKEESDFLIDHMRTGMSKGNPQVFLAYLWSPGHTIATTFDRKTEGAFEKYQKRYVKRSKTTALEINKIIRFIEKEDPEAIVFVFGDHGPYISRRDTFEENRVFFIQDRFGVYGGIYPSDRCAESFDEPYNNDFMTIVQGAHLIIRCLTGGTNAFITREEYRLPSPIPKELNRYEDYLYE